MGADAAAGQAGGDERVAERVGGGGEVEAGGEHPRAEPVDAVLVGRVGQAEHAGGEREARGGDGEGGGVPADDEAGGGGEWAAAGGGASQRRPGGERDPAAVADAAGGVQRGVDGESGEPRAACRSGSERDDAVCRRHALALRVLGARGQHRGPRDGAGREGVPALGRGGRRRARAEQVQDHRRSPGCGRPALCRRCSYTASPGRGPVQS